MKKILLFSAAVLMLAACHKEPYRDSDNEYLVYTSPDKNVDFTQFKTYHVADSLLVIGKYDKPVYSKTKAALDLIDAFVENMDTRGYTEVESVDDADLGIQLTYVINTEKFIQYYDSPYWWLDYPGYWSPGYWGNWYGYYYPRPVVYSYTTNALLTDMVDLTAVPADQKPLEVIWSSYIGGPAGNSSQGDIRRMLDAIGQAFAQSAYIDAGKTL